MTDNPRKIPLDSRSTPPPHLDGEHLWGKRPCDGRWI